MDHRTVQWLWPMQYNTSQWGLFLFCFGFFLRTWHIWVVPCWNCCKWLHDGLPQTAWSFIIISATCSPLRSMRRWWWRWWRWWWRCWVWCASEGLSGAGERREGRGGEGLMELTHFCCVCVWCHEGEIIRTEPRNQSDTLQNELTFP